jgi:Tfp pilus assembly protein PilN
MPIDISIPNDLRKLLRFGSCAGIEIGVTDLEVAAVRVRPSGIRVMGRLTIHDYATRPAAEWGGEYIRFLKGLGAAYLAATVLLPRRDVVVRQIALPGVAAKDMEGAIALQLDTLHPYGDDEVACGWSRLGAGAALVGVAPRKTVDRFAQLFSEAGILVSSFTFPAAALHSALRLGDGVPDSGFVALGPAASGGVETYGESEARPVFSARFDLPAPRAAALALAELRLPPETEPLTLENALPKPVANPVENDISRNALPYATALAGACPLLAPAANVLPKEYRRTSSRAMYVPSIALGILLLMALGGGALYSKMNERRYLESLRAQISKIQTQRQHALALDKDTDHARARAQWLDQYRQQTRKDLELLNELTRTIQPPAWTRAIDITRDTVRLQGEAPQAAPLWKILDGSKLLKNAKLDSNQPNGSGGENFMISGSREAGK